jgi:hypothetical protein
VSGDLALEPVSNREARALLLLEPEHCAHNHLAQLPPSWRNRPHGLLGQTYDRDKLEVNGRRDSYARLDDGRPTASRTSVGGDITTRAKAEGAIEGALGDYRVASEFSTAFRFSRFDSIAAGVRNVSELMGGIKGPRHEFAHPSHEGGG